MIKKTAVSVCLLLGIAVIFLISSFVFVTVKSASVQKLDKKIEDLAASKESHAKLEAQHNDWLNIRTKYAEVKKEFFIPFKNLTDFTNELNRLLEASSRRILKKEFSNTNINNEFLKMSISIIFESSYKQIKEFIFKVNQKHKMMVIKSLALKKGDTNTYCEMVLEVYFVR